MSDHDTSSTTNQDVNGQDADQGDDLSSGWCEECNGDGVLFGGRRCPACAGVGVCGQTIMSEEGPAKGVWELTQADVKESPNQPVPPAPEELWTLARAQVQPEPPPLAELTPEQQRAVDMVVDDQPRLCCLTGGPGTGKSTTIRAVVAGLEKIGLSVSLCAPSGKAAKRIKEATGYDASTIHSLVQAKPGDKRGRAPIMTPVLIVDEASMIEIGVMGMILSAARDYVRTILLVGDTNQLPPVGPGRPFHDVVNRVPTVNLNQIHRQAAQSGIVLSAHAIREGGSIQWTDDVRFVRVLPHDNLLRTVHDLVHRENLTDAQVLIPARRGPLGTMRYNEYVESQRGSTPPGVRVVRERSSDGATFQLTFRKGTRVICTSNDYQRGVFNGETGVVERIKTSHLPRLEAISVRYEGHDELKEYGGEALASGIDLAWGLTVHKCQGSEFDDVIFVVHPSYGPLLERNLIYVALTRAKKRLWIVGDDQALWIAIRKPWAESRRSTLLPALLAGSAVVVNTPNHTAVMDENEGEGEELDEVETVFFSDEPKDWSDGEEDGDMVWFGEG